MLNIHFDLEVNHRERTYKLYRLDKYDAEAVDGKYQIPIIEPEHFIPTDLIEFHNMIHNQDKNMGVHCYVDDYKIERLWTRPDEYFDELALYQCILGPDYSLYLDMPLAMKVWNVYRSRLIGQYYQSMGLTVIPSIQWAECETFEFCFDGLREGGTISVSTIGVKKDQNATRIWYEGMDEAMKRLKPDTVLIYGGDIGYDFGETKAVYYINNQTERGRRDGKQRRKLSDGTWNRE